MINQVALAVENMKVYEGIRALHAEIRSEYNSGEIVGSGAPLREVLDMAAPVAPWTPRSDLWGDGNRQGTRMSKLGIGRNRHDIS